MEELNDFLMETVSNCSKCRDCAHCFNSYCCYFAYECIRNNFSFFDIKS